MARTIGYCGYNCHLCAARSDDPDVRQRLVDGWRKIFGHQVTWVMNLPTAWHIAQSAALIGRARPA